MEDGLAERKAASLFQYPPLRGSAWLEQDGKAARTNGQRAKRTVRSIPRLAVSSEKAYMSDGEKKVLAPAESDGPIKKGQPANWPHSFCKQRVMTN